MSRWRQEGGFTFLELLIVLAVMAVATASVLLIGARGIEERTHRDALTLLRQDVLAAQAQALASRSYAFIEMRPDGYRVRTAKGVLLARQLPEGLAHVGSTFQNFAFNAQGNVTRSGTLRFRCAKRDHNAIVYLGKGRVLLEE